MPPELMTLEKHEILSLFKACVLGESSDGVLLPLLSRNEIHSDHKKQSIRVISFKWNYFKKKKTLKYSEMVMVVVGWRGERLRVFCMLH